MNCLSEIGLKAKKCPLNVWNENLITKLLHKRILMNLNWNLKMQALLPFQIYVFQLHPRHRKLSSATF